MSTTRTHHPACPARNGGLCFNCPPTEKPRTASPAIHLSCATCGEQYVALGLTDDIAARAANAGPTCCIPKTAPASDGRGEAPDLAGVTSTRADRAPVASDVVLAHVVASYGDGRADGRSARVSAHFFALLTRLRRPIHKETTQ